MVEVIESDAEIVGVALKMLLADTPYIFDSIGTGMAKCRCLQSGIGQPDIGQYDFSERVFGSLFWCHTLAAGSFRPRTGRPAG